MAPAEPPFRLRPTFDPTHARARSWRRPGGPWDGAGLQSLEPTGSHLAVVAGDTRLSASEFGGFVAEITARLRAAGIRRDHVVAWQLPNCPHALGLFWACWRIGAIAAPLHRRLGAAEVAGALDQVSPALVFAASDLPASDLDGAVPVGVSAGSLEFPAIPTPLGVPPRARRDPLADPSAAVAVRGSHLAAVLFTSGSSGVPKAVLHSHRALAYKAKLMAGVHGLEPGDPVLAPAPLAHVSGLLNGVLISAAVRGPCVLLDPWDPEVGLSLLESERIAFVGAPPIFFSQMAESPRFSRDRISLRLISTGGASVSPAFIDSTRDTYGCRVKRTYGSTEAPTITTSGPSDSHERARDTDGHPVGDAEISIHDPVSGRPLPPGEPGEIWIRGPEMFCGYADLVRTASVIAKPGGWYRSGDLGSVDSEGWLRVTGRLSDTIIRAGENISASEVEAVLEAHPDIRNAVAVPVLDRQVGERVAAFIVCSSSFSLEQCRSWFADRGITKFKTPELVIVLDSIPTLPAGKPDRAALKQMADRIARGAES
jgi:acyl-CoA synthetase (AMP-forming)/AMP-acid ligase II